MGLTRIFAFFIQYSRIIFNIHACRTYDPARYLNEHIPINIRCFIDLGDVRAALEAIGLEFIWV